MRFFLFYFSFIFFYFLLFGGLGSEIEVVLNCLLLLFWMLLYIQIRKEKVTAGHILHKSLVTVYT